MTGTKLVKMKDIEKSVFINDYIHLSEYFIKDTQSMSLPINPNSDEVCIALNIFEEIFINQKLYLLINNNSSDGK